MEIKWLGHSAFYMISDKGVKLLVDPFISNNPSCTIAVEEIDPDIICVTHGHSDHFGDTMEIANRTGATIVANHEISLYLSKQGFETISSNIGGSVFIKDIKITMLDAKHSSAIDFVEDCLPGGSPGSFMFSFEDGLKVFHSGDTGLFKDMKDVIGDIYKPDIAMVPIGDRFTIGPFEGALASLWLNPKVVIPMHYNTFPVIEQDTSVFSNFVKQLNPEIDVLVMNPGETYVPDIKD